MFAGRLRHFVSLKNTSDSNGAYDLVLDPEYTWAAIEPLAPGNGGRLTTFVVTMRYHPQVTVDTQITHDGRLLYVKGVQDVQEQHRELRLLCEEAA